MLASGAKDGLIRLWRLSTNQENLEETNQNNDDFELKIKPLTMSIPSNNSEDHQLICVLESVLRSHEGMVSDLCWSFESSKGSIDLFFQLFSKISLLESVQL